MKKQFVKYSLGIDISKDSFHACLMGIDSSDAVSILGQAKFPQTPGGFSKLIAWLSKRNLTIKARMQVVMEATGVYHEALLFELHEKGFNVCLILAKQGKDYARSLNQFSKNDKLDSQVLAHLSLHRKLDSWQPFSPHIYQIRNLMRHRRSLVKEVQVFKNRRHALEHAKSASSAVVDSISEIIQTLERHKKRAEKEAEKLAKADAKLWKKIEKIIASFPGVGLITMLEVVTETNGFEAFTSIGQLVRYAGYDIIENQSGKHTGTTKISKRGNARLRAAMYMPALSIIRHKVAPFYALFERVVKKSGKVKKAQVAVQRKLLIYLYTLWKKDEAFDPERYSEKGLNTEEQPQQSAEESPKHDYQNEQIQGETTNKKPKTQHQLLHTLNPKKGSSSSDTPELHGIASPKELTSYNSQNKKNTGNNT